MLLSMLKWLWGRGAGPRSNAQWTATSAEVERARKHRAEAVAGRSEHATVDWLEALFFRHDPIGINFEDNPDEYRAEAETIALRRDEVGTFADAQRVIHAEFVRWFDAGTAGPPERYAAIASEVWEQWSSERG